jgi:hypothetical protein
MEKVDAEAISTAIVTAIRDVGLSMDNLRIIGCIIKVIL